MSGATEKDREVLRKAFLRTAFTVGPLTGIAIAVAVTKDDFRWFIGIMFAAVILLWLLDRALFRAHRDDVKQAIARIYSKDRS
jgi:hypothetical protein